MFVVIKFVPLSGYPAGNMRMDEPRCMTAKNDETTGKEGSEKLAGR